MKQRCHLDGILSVKVADKTRLRQKSQTQKATNF